MKNLEDGKYYNKEGDFADTRHGAEIDEKSAMEIMKDCGNTKPPHGIFATKKTCQEMCKKARKELGYTKGDIVPGEIHGDEVNGFYYHCHPDRECHSHCWWY